MENRGEVCFEEEVERLRRYGMSVDEISQQMGVDPAWVQSLMSMWGDENSGEESEA